MRRRGEVPSLLFGLRLWFWFVFDVSTFALRCFVEVVLYTIVLSLSAHLYLSHLIFHCPFPLFLFICCTTTPFFLRRGRRTVDTHPCPVPRCTRILIPLLGFTLNDILRTERTKNIRLLTGLLLYDDHAPFIRYERFLSSLYLLFPGFFIPRLFSRVHGLARLRISFIGSLILGGLDLIPFPSSSSFCFVCYCCIITLTYTEKVPQGEALHPHLIFRRIRYDYNALSFFLGDPHLPLSYPVLPLVRPLLSSPLLSFPSSSSSVPLARPLKDSYNEWRRRRPCTHEVGL